MVNDVHHLEKKCGCGQPDFLETSSSSEVDTVVGGYLGSQPSE